MPLEKTALLVYAVAMSGSKFQPGRPNIALVKRKRLIDALDKALDQKLAFVIAPPGFGKSTLLQQWYDELKERGILCAWLNLDAAECDPNLFLSQIVLSVADAGVDVAELEVGAQNGFADSPLRSVLATFVRVLNRYNKKIVLTLDDYYLADCEQTNSLVKQLIREAPDKFTLVINSRLLPALDAPSLIAAGNATEIGPDLLRLTIEEAAELLGDAVRAEDTESIYDKTEGWPVAVQLAKVQISARPDVPIGAASSSGLIAFYLTEQVLSSIDDEIRQFLLSVSVLDRFSTDLADVIRGEKDSWRLMRRLQPFSAFLIPLDEEGTWYRLHHLFSEYLLGALRDEAAQRIPEIQMSASKWYEENGETLSAVRYAAAAEAYDECVRIILDAGGWKIILTVGIGHLRSLLRLVPKKIIHAHPRMLIARAYLHCKDGEIAEARQLYDLAAAFREGNSDAMLQRDAASVGTMINLYDEKEGWDKGPSLPDGVLSRDLSVVGTLINGYSEEAGWDAAPGVDDDNQSLMVAFDELEAGTMTCEAVVIAFARGDMHAAEGHLRTAFQLMRKSGSVLGLNYCYLHAAVLALYEADFSAAEAHINRAMELAENNFGSDSGLKHIAMVLSYALKFWMGDVDPDELQEFSQTLSYIEEYDGWTEIYVLGLDAAYHFAVRCGEMTFAAQLIERFVSVAETRDLGRLMRFTEIVNLDFATRRDRQDQQLLLQERIVAWMQTIDLDTTPLNWLCFTAALEKTAAHQLADRSLITSLAKKSRGFCAQNGAKFFQVRLGIAIAQAHARFGDAEAGRQELAGALKLASRQKIAGLFLHPELGILLRQVRDELRADEKEVISANFATGILDRLRASKASSILSAREQEILDLVARGLSNKQIANTLELTENTVKFHLKNVFSKLSVNKRTQAIAVGQRLGLLTDAAID